METSFKQKVLAFSPEATQNTLPAYSGSLQRIYINDRIDVWASGYVYDGQDDFLWEKAWNFIQEEIARKMEA
jgi:hypothetical protein